MAEKYHPLVKSVGSILAETLDPERVQTILRAAQARCNALYAENAGDGKSLKAHTFKRIYPGIAVYEAMRQSGLDGADALWHLREYFQRYCARVAPCLRRLIAFPGLAKKIPGLFFRYSLKSFSPEAGFGYEFPAAEGNAARFDVVKCPYVEICGRYGCPEIVKAFCDSDDAAYGDMHPRLIWGRTQTIGHGGDRCDFLLEYK